jgi:acyl-CoA synthetase (AMP-forming)/AMP-acid ligase II
VSICTILSMAAAARPERQAFGRTTFGALEDAANRGASWLRGEAVGTVAYLGHNSPQLSTVLFAAAGAGVPFAPLNYRLPVDALRALLDRLERPLVIAGSEHVAAATATGHRVVVTGDWAELIRQVDPGPAIDADPDSAAVLLFTSGTTAEPKCVVLRHTHLLSYVLGTVEFAGAAETDCALVCVPPYHVAGIGSALSNVYSGRRVVHLPDFDPATWLDLVRSEKVTSAMVVPTMLARIVDELAGRPANCPSLVSLAYGGARMPRPVLEAALRAFPGTAFTNAYGLTETSSTIAVLGPEDHRDGVTSGDPAVRRRLDSAGRLVPGLEAQIRATDGQVRPTGLSGELWVRGPQVSGEYRGAASVLDTGGWFPTRDLARLDDEGYLYLEGRSDDTVIRAGENIAPAEVEDALLRHPAVAEAAVIGVPDDEWGQRLVAVVVGRPGEPVDEQSLRAHVRGLLRGSRTPDQVVFRDELPQTPTGKILRRRLVAELAGQTPAGAPAGDVAEPACT